MINSTLQRVQSRMAEANQRRMHPEIYCSTAAESQTGNEEAMDVGPEAEMDKQDEEQMEPQAESAKAEINEDEEIVEEDDLEIEIPEYLLVPEGPCEFTITSAKPLKEVETAYGLKNQVLIAFTVK